MTYKESLENEIKEDYKMIETYKVAIEKNDNKKEMLIKQVTEDCKYQNDECMKTINQIQGFIIDRQKKLKELVDK